MKHHETIKWFLNIYKKMSFFPYFKNKILTLEEVVNIVYSYILGALLYFVSNYPLIVKLVAK